MNDPVHSLYVHVPFCAHKCSYCAFYSHAPNVGVVDRYVSALIQEIELAAGDLKPKTIFFGGGTPSILSIRQWERILQAMEKLNLLGAEEWTVECNPATVSLDKARLLRSYGVNRISMGVQSLDDGLLDRLGRIHSREMVFKSFEILRQAGFDNINVDLMFGIPSQTMAQWRSTLGEALSLGSEHLSCYEVIYEEDTPLFAQLQAGEIDVDEDLACSMYEELIQAASSKGLHQYEIANFARGNTASSSEVPEFACKHNVNYWRGGSFYGLGPSATGYVRGLRTRNWANTTLYCERIEAGQSPADFSEQLPALARAGEIAAFGLRMNAGWPLELFKSRTGFDLASEWRVEIEESIGRGLASLSAERFRLTEQGLRFADAVAELFLRPEAV